MEVISTCKDDELMDFVDLKPAFETGWDGVMELWNYQAQGRR